MFNWKEIKPFRDTLIDAFDENSLAAMLQYHCRRRLDRLSSKSEPLDKRVDDVIAHAVRDGWLDDLAAGALAANPHHAALQAAVHALPDARDLHGRPDDQEAAERIPLPDAIYDELRLYLQWMRDRSSNLPLLARLTHPVIWNRSANRCGASPNSRKQATCGARC